MVRYLVIPALAGLVATWGVYMLVSQHAQAKAAPTAKVVVATRTVPAKSVLDAQDVKIAAVPVTLAAGAAAKTQVVVGRITVAPLAAGQIVYAGSLAPVGNSGALSYHVPTGMRAESIHVTDVSGVSGLIQPGDRVDVIDILSKSIAGQDEAHLLMQNVQVLAVGSNQQASSGSAGGKGSTYQDVTVALSPQAAVTLALAETRAQIALVLRPAVDHGTVGSISVTDQLLAH